MNPGWPSGSTSMFALFEWSRSGKPPFGVGAVLSLGDHQVVACRAPGGLEVPDSGPKWMPGAALRWSWKRFTKQKSCVAAWSLSQLQLPRVLGSQLQRNAVRQS